MIRQDINNVDSQEKPRLVFSFGVRERSYFIGCGEHMEWNNLPEDLEYILKNRALEVLALSLGEDDAFYCRYIAKRNRTEYTVTGNLPGRLEFLLSAWWANQYEVPHVTFGSDRSYFFQCSAMTVWERIPHRLEEALMDLRESPEITMPPRCVSLGWDGSFLLLTGDDGECVTWDAVDAELADKLQDLVSDEKRVVESAILSASHSEDYMLMFSDGSIFYSVPDSLIPTVQRFVKTYHEALVQYAERMEPRESPQAHDQFSLELPDGFFGWTSDGISKFIESAVASHSPIDEEPQQLPGPSLRNSPRSSKRRLSPQNSEVGASKRPADSYRDPGVRGKDAGPRGSRRGMAGAMKSVRTDSCQGGWCGCQPKGLGIGSEIIEL